MHEGVYTRIPSCGALAKTIEKSGEMAEEVFLAGNEASWRLGHINGILKDTMEKGCDDIHLKKGPTLMDSNKDDVTY